MKASRILLLPLVTALLLNLAGCPDPQSQGNLPPTASFWDFKVNGAGTLTVNGGYNLDGTYPIVLPNGQRKYTKTDGTYKLFAFYYDDPPLYLDNNRYWAIDTNLRESEANPSNFSYYFHNPSFPNLSSPPQNGWTAGTGAAGAPTVSRWAIQGDTASATPGKILTAQYNFTDPDGDAEGTSLFQWYRFDAEAETDTSLGTALGTSKTYTTVAEDATRYLRFQVTPVDNKGNHGDPVLSGPSFKIGGGT